MRPSRSTVLRLAPWLLVPAFAFAAPKHKEPPVPVDSRPLLLAALSSEIDRAMTKLKLADNEPPFFVALQLVDTDRREVEGRFGAVFDRDEHRARQLFADVRVGSYQNDSTPDPDAIGWDFDFDDAGFSPTHNLPIDDDPTAIKRAAWLVVDDQYKRALAAFLKKQGKRVNRPDDPKRPDSFMKVPVVKHTDAPVPFGFDANTWSGEVRRVTAKLSARPGFFDAQMRVTAEKVVRLFASNEGSRIVTERVIYGLHVDAHTRAPDGMLLENGRTFYAPIEAELPRGIMLDAEIDALITELEALTKAPLVDPFTGPALLAPEATGVLFHEAVGHRLEGDRQGDENEGRTFRGQVGKPVLPTFVSVLDDPTLERWTTGGRSIGLNGFYRFDEQGVAAQAVPLVEDGVLKNFLLSRRPIEGFSASNGHGRAQGIRFPVARMANLVVVASKRVPEAELKQRLIALAKEQGKPYGIYLRDITGGNTNTANIGYQAFKGTSRLVYRIDAQTGAEELVRGVELIGTPLSTINRIVAMGDRTDVFNGYCGAESGYVPVSTVAPSTLVSEIELQRTRKDMGRPPLLPPP